VYILYIIISSLWGLSGRKIETRVKEHKARFTHHNNHSQFAKHLLENGHFSDFTPNVLHIQGKEQKLDALEKMEILYRVNSNNCEIVNKLLYPSRSTLQHVLIPTSSNPTHPATQPTTNHCCQYLLPQRPKQRLLPKLPFEPRSPPPILPPPTLFLFPYKSKPNTFSAFPMTQSSPPRHPSEQSNSQQSRSSYPSPFPPFPFPSTHYHNPLPSYSVKNLGNVLDDAAWRRNRSC
jgi:hypothetical protein